VDRGVIATASELFEARHYPSVLAVCADALDAEPECLPLLLLRARAHIALRRDVDAQADLRDVIRLDAECSLAFRLLGELAARRDENESAAVFFRETLRLDPGDRSAHDWLQIVDATARTTRAAARQPAAEQVRFARGTQTPGQPPLERPTQPFVRSLDRAALAPRPATATTPPMGTATTPPAGTATSAMADGSSAVESKTLHGRPALQPPAQAAPRITRTTSRPVTPELPGFGEYLVTSGILSRERLRAAQAYQRSMKVQLATAIVTLGLASPQRMAWAAVAHESQLARDRQP
jgi:hypothetical protein